MITNLNEVDFSKFEVFIAESENLVTDKEAYLTICKSLIEILKEKELNKVVLSRLKWADLNQSPIELFKILNTRYKNTFNYLISIENVGSWLGATPETLVSINKLKLKTVALAGTKTVDNQWTNKELEEQNIVTQYIERSLNQHLQTVEVSDTITIKAGNVHHLKTEFSGILKDESDWVKIVKDLHPTPATCGVPKTESFEKIKRIEPHNRKFYTGFLGPISEESKQLFVNLRCMEIQENGALLYLGGGITAKSNADSEWNETEKKAETLLSIINTDFK